MIAWREKAAAFAVHFLVTLALMAGAAALVFLVWFPYPFREMLGGTRLFEILVMCDLGLGPLTSFIIYNSKKSRRALLFDYTVVGIVQLAAFGYGLYSVAGTRPISIAFVLDRIEVVTSREIDDADFAAAAEPYRNRPLWKPRLVAIEMPTDQKEREQMAVSGMAGKDYPAVPKYYVSYEQKLPQIRQRSLPVSVLEKHHPQAKPLVARAAAELHTTVDELTWLPVKHPKGFWTALLDPETGRPVYWLPVDPY